MTVDETTGACTINGEIAPDGDYKCADGTTISVKDGFITNISSPNSQPQDQAQAQAQTQPPAQQQKQSSNLSEIEDLKKQMDEITAKLNETTVKCETLTTDLETKQKEIDSMKADNDKVVTELNEKLSKKAVAQPIDTTPLPNAKKFEEMSTAEQVWYKLTQKA